MFRAHTVVVSVFGVLMAFAASVAIASESPGRAVSSSVTDTVSPVTTAELFVDFDSPVDGVGTLESPWNTLVGKPVEGAEEITLWLQGEASPLKIPEAIRSTAAGVETLRVKSRHLVDPSAPRAHLTGGIRLSELTSVPVRDGVELYVLPPEAGTFVSVLRDWRIPDHTAIPVDGLEPGLAFDRAYAESFRVPESLDVVMPTVSSLDALDDADVGHVPFLSTFYLKTLSGAAPGVDGEPEHRALVDRPGAALVTFNAFGTAVDHIEIAGLIFSLNLTGGNQRTIAINPALNVTLRDNLFVNCADDDNVAAVNGGGEQYAVRSLRNQHIGVGDDGGPLVVSTQGGRPAYGFYELRDQVSHFGYRLNLLDGTDAGLESIARFGVGTFHAGKVLEARIERNIALAYNGKEMIPFQFPVGVDNIPADPRDPAGYNVTVDDVYIDRTARINDFNVQGVHVSRSYFGPSVGPVQGLFSEISPALFSSCFFEVDAEYSVLGNIGEFDAAFVNCTFRVRGPEELAFVGVGGLPGRVFLRDNVVERVGGTGGLRFANGWGSLFPPPFRPDAILGWDGTPNLGRHWFGPGTLGSTPGAWQSPAFPTTPSSQAQFEAMHGAGLRFGSTGAEGLAPEASAEDVADAYTGAIVGPQSVFGEGPVGLNGAGFTARLGAFQTGGPEGCSLADLAFPYGVVDLSDIDAFVVAFTAGADEADLAPPAGVIDLTDVDRFVNAFLTGCNGVW
ncbi:MAG: GC-type dockerin domain-anchored protein [Planctomycetota bacterium]